jgi:hypothetical protein
MVVLFRQGELVAACVEVAVNRRRIAGLPWREHTDFHAGRFKSQQVLPRKEPHRKLDSVRCGNPYIEQSLLTSFLFLRDCLQAFKVSAESISLYIQ